MIQIVTQNQPMLIKLLPNDTVINVQIDVKILHITL